MSLSLTQQFGSRVVAAVLQMVVRERVDIAWKTTASNKAEIEDSITLSCASN
jgi:hypothetical protein